MPETVAKLNHTPTGDELLSTDFGHGSKKTDKSDGKPTDSLAMLPDEIHMNIVSRLPIRDFRHYGEVDRQRRAWFQDENTRKYYIHNSLDEVKPDGFYRNDFRNHDLANKSMDFNQMILDMVKNMPMKKVLSLLGQMHPKAENYKDLRAMCNDATLDLAHRSIALSKLSQIPPDELKNFVASKPRTNNPLFNSIEGISEDAMSGLIEDFYASNLKAYDEFKVLHEAMPSGKMKDEITKNLSMAMVRMRWDAEMLGRYEALLADCKTMESQTSHAATIENLTLALSWMPEAHITSDRFNSLMIERQNSKTGGTNERSTCNLIRAAHRMHIDDEGVRRYDILCKDALDMHSKKMRRESLWYLSVMLTKFSATQMSTRFSALSEGLKECCDGMLDERVGKYPKVVGYVIENLSDALSKMQHTSDSATRYDFLKSKHAMIFDHDAYVRTARNLLSTLGTLSPQEIAGRYAEAQFEHEVLKSKEVDPHTLSEATGYLSYALSRLPNGEITEPRCARILNRIARMSKGVERDSVVMNLTLAFSKISMSDNFYVMYDQLRTKILEMDSGTNRNVAAQCVARLSARMPIERRRSNLEFAMNLYSELSSQRRQGNHTESLRTLLENATIDLSAVVESLPTGELLPKHFDLLSHNISVVQSFQSHEYATRKLALALVKLVTSDTYPKHQIAARYDGLLIELSKMRVGADRDITVKILAAVLSSLSPKEISERYGSLTMELEHIHSDDEYYETVQELARALSMAQPQTINQHYGEAQDEFIDSFAEIDHGDAQQSYLTKIHNYTATYLCFALKNLKNANLPVPNFKGLLNEVPKITSPDLRTLVEETLSALVPDFRLA
jgi:hypothetical protein